MLQDQFQCGSGRFADRHSHNLSAYLADNGVTLRIVAQLDLRTCEKIIIRIICHVLIWILHIRAIQYPTEIDHHIVAEIAQTMAKTRTNAIVLPCGEGSSSSHLLDVVFLDSFIKRSHDDIRAVIVLEFGAKVSQNGWYVKVLRRSRTQLTCAVEGIVIASEEQSSDRNLIARFFLIEKLW